MQSSGGVASLEEAAAHGAILLSGPAGGVVGAARDRRASGLANALAFDMGGTSTDVCLSRTGSERRTDERTSAASRCGCRWSTSTRSARAAGRSPGSTRAARSASARGSPAPIPGPACYGRGGPQPTVTDANLLLGRLPGEAARRLSSTAPRPAGARRHRPRAVVEIVNAEMVRALRVVSVERGHDPRDFALVAFGGAGPLHACALAEELGVPTVLVPGRPGGSRRSGSSPATSVATASAPYVRPARGGGKPPEGGRRRPSIRRTVVRARLPLGGGLDERFHVAHAERYGYADRVRRVELVAVRTAEERSGPRRGVVVRRALGLPRAPRWWSSRVRPAGSGGLGRGYDGLGTLVLERSGVGVISVELQVIGSALRAIAEEMGAVLVRSAFSANIKERRDCSTALFDAAAA